MKLFLDPAAVAEIEDAAAYYQSHANAALAHSFIDEFERISRLLLANPQLGARGRNGRYHYALRRFPYSVIYQLVENELRIIAVAHQRRKPGYWRDRGK